MRKTELLIGAASLVVASVSVTLYLVNHAQRTKQIQQPGGGVATPEQVLSPRDLFGTPESGKTENISDSVSSVSLERHAATETENAPAMDTQPTITQPIPVGARAPSRASKVVYPAWQTSNAQIQDARAATDPGGYISPLWSPVGLDIAFTREGRNAVFISGALPGGTVRALVNDAKCGEDFSWNSDGMSLRVRAADGQYDQVLITGERYPAPAAPARVFSRDEKIYFIPSTRPGENRELLVSGPEDRFNTPKLSPDETRVVYRGAETGLYIGAVDGSGSVNLGAGTNPSWLPDSTGIVYDQQVSDGRAIVDSDVWHAYADGSVRTNLTNTPGIVELYPSVAPDGERIAFSAGGSIYVGKLFRGK
ncbi:MAG: TolB family protein [Candidatus Sumerlaeaceae bacterium]